MKDSTNAQKDIYAFIHTFEIRVKQNKQLFKLMQNERKLVYVKNIRGDETETILEINPNKFHGYKIKTLSEFNSTLKLILSELKITDYYFSRIDVTLDSEIEFEKCYKVNSFIINLDSTRLNVDNTFSTTHKSGAKRQYILKSSNYQHAFYDKKAESKGKDDACSRTEIRYIKSIDGDNITSEKAIDATIKYLPKMMKSYNATTTEITDMLYNLYIKETASDAENSVSSFTEFVVKHEDMIKNKKVLTSLYKRCLNGSCASWLSKYRKTKSIELPLKQDIQARLNEYKNALIYYKNH